jgi:S-adenosylmethionine hydrolase
MDTITGRVIQINSTGDLVTDIPVDAVAHLIGQEDVEVRVVDHFTQGIFPREHGEPANTLVAVLGESGFLEIGIVGVSIYDMLAIPVGQEVRIRPTSETVNS